MKSGDGGFGSLDRYAALFAAGEALAAEVRYMLEECSDDQRTQALRDWEKAVASIRKKP